VRVHVFHEWSVWVDVEMPFYSTVVGAHTKPMQQRRCKKCGILKIRSLR
jgi:hypothetical protein